MADKPIDAFLLVEFETAWEHLRSIDDRRFHIVQFFVTLNVGLATVIGALLTSEVIDGSGETITTVVLAAGAVSITTWMLWGVLKSERAVNVRYRNKINLIRSILTEDFRDDPRLAGYFTSGAHTGIRLRDYYVHHLGGTLRSVRRFLVFVCALWWVAAATATILWWVN